MKTFERLKTFVLVLLVLCAVFLSWLQFSVDRRFSLEAASAEEPLAGSGSLLPLVIAAGRSDMRYAVPNNHTSILSAYGRLTPLLSEVLGSASDAESANEEQWREALLRSGIFIDFFGELPAGTLARILGVSGVRNDELMFSCLFLDLSDHMVSLYLASPATQEYYRCTSAVRSADTSSHISPGGNAADFVFEMFPDQIGRAHV